MELNQFKDLLAGGKLNRRQVNQILASVGIATVSVPLTGNLAQAATNLYLFTWAVYDSPELHPAYIEQYGATPHVGLFADNDEALTKLQAGFKSDISVPTSFMVGRYRDSGLLQPIDPSRIDAWDDLRNNFLSGLKVRDEGAGTCVKVIWVVSKLGLTTS